MNKKSWRDKNSENAKIIIKISIITIVINLMLVVSKIVLGVIFGNLSVISDAIHSASDLFTSFLIIIAVLLSSPKRDQKHNYGHEKVEPLVVMFLAIIIGGVAVFLGYEGIHGILAPKDTEINLYLISIVILSIIVKEGMFWYEMYYAKKIKSDMLKADAWHSRSDALASIAVLAGLVSSTFIGTDIVESIAVVIVALFILKVAFDIAKPAIDQLLDRSAGEAKCKMIREIALQVNGVKDIDLLRTRMFGNNIYVDMDIAVDGQLTVDESHEIAHTLHDILEQNEELRIKHIQIHVNPHKEKTS